MQKELKIRKSLIDKHRIVMTSEDWVKFKNICKKKLIKDEFLDSLPVWHIEDVIEEKDGEFEFREKCTYMYDGQWHKNVFTKDRKIKIREL